MLDGLLNIQGVLAAASNPGNGAAVVFVGTVRDTNEGRHVTGIDYAAYQLMAERELANILQEACVRFDTEHVVTEHRVGTLQVGDASVVIAVSHPHRGKAYEASRYVIEEIKKRLPVWKREHYSDGTRAWVHAGGTSTDTGAAPAKAAGVSV